MAFSAAIGAGAAAASVGQAVAQTSPTHRQCFIQIVNGCEDYTLSNPRFYTNSGSCATPFPPTIPPSASGSALFIKTPHTACGSVGVFTYDLLHSNGKAPREKLAVMFSVPYDFNCYSNWYALGVYDDSKECDYDLYCEMYYETNEFFARGKANGPALSYKGGEITILATMSDAYSPVMKIEIRESGNMKWF